MAQVAILLGEAAANDGISSLSSAAASRVRGDSRERDSGRFSVVNPSGRARSCASTSMIRYRPRVTGDAAFSAIHPS